MKYIQAVWHLLNAEMFIQNKIVGQNGRPVGKYVANIDSVRSLL